MKVSIVRDYEELSEQTALLVTDRLQQKPDLVLGLATGSTPLGLYRRLVAEYQAGRLNLAQVTTFNLDEYCGIAPDHKNSYHSFMAENLFSLVNIDPDHQHFPACDNQSCGQYEANIQAAGGIDLQILGIGRNGHIGFNEPESSFNSRTRIVDLSAVTINDNKRFFNQGEEVPRRAVTMGLATIMSAKEILLLASGEAKQVALRETVQQPPNEKIPASVLQRHPNVTVIADQAAGKRAE